MSNQATKNIAHFMALGAAAFASGKAVVFTKPRSWQQNAFQVGYAMAKAGSQG